MRKKIIIKKPYIKKVNTGVRLCSDIILTDGNLKTMYFEVEDAWQKYLCVETSDCFLVGLLNYAFSKGYDIECEGVVNERLLYQMKTYILPTLSGIRKGYKTIEISAPATNEKIPNSGAVGTSASSGVDSFYSIVRHLNNDIPRSYRVTHLLIANQFNYYNGEKDTRERYRRLLEKSRPISEHYGLKLIGIYTNHHEFMFDGFVDEYSYRMCSYVLALQKLFKTYYVSSSTAFRDFDFNKHASQGTDLFHCSFASTDNLTFYSSGGERMRTEKIEYFADDPYIQNNLQVCTFSENNCSICEKCMRTETALAIMGRLGEFNHVFDLTQYQKKKNSFYVETLANEHVSSKDLKMFAKKYGFKWPFHAYICAVIVRKPFLLIKNIFSDFKFIRKLYYRLHIDELRFGKEKARIQRFGKEMR